MQTTSREGLRCCAHTSGALTTTGDDGPPFAEWLLWPCSVKHVTLSFVGRKRPDKSAADLVLRPLEDAHSKD